MKVLVARRTPLATVDILTFPDFSEIVSFASAPLYIPQGGTRSPTANHVVPSSYHLNFCNSCHLVQTAVTPRAP